MVGWWKMLHSRPVKSIQFGESGGFVWHVRRPRLRELALSMGEASVATVFTDASGLRGWGATMGDRFIQGKWSVLNWKDRGFSGELKKIDSSR